MTATQCPECGRHTVTAGVCTPDCGYVQHEAVAGCAEVAVILQDLIAELKPLLRYDFVDPIERAEQRLREVSGDE